MCEWFDQTCDKLLDHLEKRQLTDNTIIVYLADNGWAARDTLTIFQQAGGVTTRRA